MASDPPKLVRSTSAASSVDMDKDVKMAQKWVDSSRNEVQFELTADLAERRVIILCPTVESPGKDGGSRFSITLDKPHAIFALDKALRDLEDASTEFCFGGKHRSIINVVSFAAQYVGKLWEADEDAWDREDPENRAGGDDDDDHEAPAEIDYDFKTIEKAEVSEMQRDLITALAARLSVSLGAAGILLRHYKWNKDKLIKAYKAKPTAVAREVGCASVLHGVQTSVSTPDATFLCDCCFSDNKMENSFALKCNHRLCTPCWKLYLESQVNVGTAAGTNCLFSTCPGYECKEVLGEEVYEYLCDDDLVNKYRSFLLNSFVDDSENMKWCPAPGCEKVVALGHGKRTVKCACGYKFCFRCKEEAHFPSNCDQATAWKQRDKGSASLDVKYIMEQTKPCPHCGVRTNKNGGCMYMSCAQCKKAWCWQCGKSDHHVWECNRPAYEMKEVKEGDDINRYLFYFERYFNHNESRKIAEKQRLATIEKIKEMVTQGMHLKGVDFLQDAVDLIIECRRVLKWTYVKGFSINPKNEKELKLFEFRQSELEKYTEQLNQLTEKSAEDLEKNRKNVINWTEALHKYLKGMEDDVREGDDPTPAETADDKKDDPKKEEKKKKEEEKAKAAAAAIAAGGVAPKAEDVKDKPKKEAKIVEKSAFFSFLRSKKEKEKLDAAAAAAAAANGGARDADGDAVMATGDAGAPAAATAAVVGAAFDNKPGSLLIGTAKLGVPGGRFAPGWRPKPKIAPPGGIAVPAAAVTAAAPVVAAAPAKAAAAKVAAPKAAAPKAAPKAAAKKKK